MQLECFTGFTFLDFSLTYLQIKPSLFVCFGATQQCSWLITGSGYIMVYWGLNLSWLHARQDSTYVVVLI